MVVSYLGAILTWLFNPLKSYTYEKLIFWKDVSSFSEKKKKKKIDQQMSCIFLNKSRFTEYFYVLSMVMNLKVTTIILTLISWNSRKENGNTCKILFLNLPIKFHNRKFATKFIYTRHGLQIWIKHMHYLESNMCIKCSDLHRDEKAGKWMYSHHLTAEKDLWETLPIVSRYCWWIY